MECSSCAQRCRALALADGGWQRLATLLCCKSPPGLGAREGNQAQGLYSACCASQQDHTSVSCILFSCAVVQAKDLPIGEIVQKATLKKVLLSEQKVGVTATTGCSLAGKGDTLVVCAPAEGACAQLWVLLQACGVWYARVGCVSLPNTAVYIVLQQCIRSARGVQQFAAYSSVHNLPACVPAGAHPWCGSQQGACKGSGNLHITAEAEVGTGLGLQHGSACTANKQHSAGVSLLHESLCCPLTPDSAPSLCVMHRLSACKAERQQSW